MKILRWAIPASILLVAFVLLFRALWMSSRSGEALLGLVLLIVSVALLGGTLLNQRARLRRAKEALALSRVRAEACVEASPDGVVIVQRTRIISANPAFRSLLAIPPDESIGGQDIGDSIAPGDRERFVAWIKQRSQGVAEPERLDVQGVTRTGATIPVEVAAALIPADGVVQMALFLRDLSARRTLEQRARDSDRIEALADIAETIAAEFQKILGQIRRHAREGRQEQGEAAPARFEAVERLSGRGLALVRRVRTFAPSGGDASARHPLDLARVVREVSADFLRGLPADLSLRIVSEGPARMVVSAEASQVRHALWQILENARDAQHEGEILVRTRTLEFDDARAEHHPASHAGTYAIIEVRDTGAGMSEDVRQRAFEPFFSTKGGRATGLGLTAVYGTARSHGGFAELDSEPGRGTIVRFAMPLLPESALPLSADDAPADPRALWRGREHVLVVDDDTASCDAAREILERYGYLVETVTTPRQALERLRHKPAVDAVLLDMVLPGWSGLEVLRRIVRIWPGLRVVMISPYPLPDQEASALQSGAADTFRKPLTDPDLPRAIRETLDRPPPPPGPGVLN